MMPEALLRDRRIHSTAKVLWGLLDRYAGDSERAWPGQQRLAEDLGISVQGVQKQLYALRDAGWLEIIKPDRSRGTCSYIVNEEPYQRDEVAPTPVGPMTPTPVGPVAPTPVGTNESQGIESKTPPVYPPLQIVADEIDGHPIKRVVTAAGPPVAEVLTAFNEISGRSFTVKAWGDKIGRCLRAHPELSAEQVRQIIARQFVDPWWDESRTSPSVIFGTIAQFERCLNQTDAPRISRADRRALDIVNGWGDA
jgi:Helix-turn-helix domain